MTGPNGNAAYVKPIVDYLGSCNTGRVSREWKILGVLPRRDERNVDQNKKLPGAPGKEWPWEAFVAVVNDEEEGETTKSVGKHITDMLNMHASRSGATSRYVFYRVVSNDNNLRPLSYYLLDEDTTDVFLALYKHNNEKVHVMQSDELLRSYFGSAERGRELLALEAW